MMEEIVDIRFKFGYDAKPLADLQKQTGQFGAALDEARESLAVLGDKGLVGLEDADLALGRAASTVELLGVRLIETEQKATLAKLALMGAEKGSHEWYEATRRLIEAEHAAAALEDQLSQVNRRLEESARAARTETAGAFGDMSSRLSSFAGLAQGLGASEIGEGLMIASDVFDAVEAVALLPDTLMGLKEAAQSLGPAIQTLGASAQALPGVLGALASGGAAAAGGLGATAAALGALLAPLLPLVAAIGAVAAVVKIFEGHARRAEQAAKAAAEARMAEYETERELRGLLLEGSAEDVRARREHIRVMAGLQKAQLANEVDALVEASSQEVTKVHNVGRTLVSGFFDNLFAGRELWDQAGYEGNLFGVDQASLDQAEQLRGEMAELDRQMGLLSESTLALLEAREAEIDATEREIAAIERGAMRRVRVAGLAQSKSLEQIQEEVEANRDMQAAHREMVTSYRARVDSIEAERQALLTQGNLTDEQVVRLGTLNELYERWSAALGDAEAGLEDLTYQLADMEAAIPDIEAREAEQQTLEAQREREAQQLADLNAEMQRELSTRQLLTNATREQVRQQIQALESEKAAIESILPRLRALAKTSEEAAQQLATYESRLGQIDLEAATLEDVALPQAYMNEARQAWEEGVRLYAEYQEDLAGLEARYVERRADIIAAGQERIADLQVKQVAAVAKLESDITEARTKALADYHKREQEIRARQQMEDLWSLRQHQRNLSKLALSRDVDAFIAAQEDFAFEQEREQAERGFEEKQRRDDLQADLAEMKAAGVERLAELKRQHQEQLDTQRAAQAKQLADLDANLADEKARRKAALEEQVADLEAGLAEAGDTAAESYQQMDADFAAFLAGTGEGVSLLAEAGTQAMADAVEDVEALGETETQAGEEPEITDSATDVQAAEEEARDLKRHARDEQKQDLQASLDEETDIKEDAYAAWREAELDAQRAIEEGAEAEAQIKADAAAEQVEIVEAGAEGMAAPLQAAFDEIVDAAGLFAEDIKRVYDEETEIKRAALEQQLVVAQEALDSQAGQLTESYAGLSEQVGVLVDNLEMHIARMVAIDIAALTEGLTLQDFLQQELEALRGFGQQRLQEVTAQADAAEALRAELHAGEMESMAAALEQEKDVKLGALEDQARAQQRVLQSQQHEAVGYYRAMQGDFGAFIQNIAGTVQQINGMANQLASSAQQAAQQAQQAVQQAQQVGVPGGSSGNSTYNVSITHNSQNNWGEVATPATVNNSFRQWQQNQARLWGQFFGGVRV